MIFVDIHGIWNRWLSNLQFCDKNSPAFSFDIICSSLIWCADWVSIWYLEAISSPIHIVTSFHLPLDVWLKDTVQISLILVITALVTVAGGWGVWYHWVSQFKEVFVSWKFVEKSLENSWNRSCKEVTDLNWCFLLKLPKLFDPFLHLGPRTSWKTGPDSSKLQAPSEVACSQSCWFENWSENDDHQNQSQLRTRHRFAMCTHDYTCDICIRD